MVRVDPAVEGLAQAMGPVHGDTVGSWRGGATMPTRRFRTVPRDAQVIAALLSDRRHRTWCWRFPEIYRTRNVVVNSFIQYPYRLKATERCDRMQSAPPAVRHMTPERRCRAGAFEGRPLCRRDYFAFALRFDSASISSVDASMMCASSIAVARRTSLLRQNSTMPRCSALAFSHPDVDEICTRR